MNIAKVIFSACTAAALIVALTACNGEQPSATTTAAAASQATAGQTDTPSTAPATVIDQNKTYDYEVREIWCDNNGQKIYGQAFVPKTNGRSPLIITSHGLGANFESGASYAKKYAPKGFAVYTFDFRGGSNINNANKSDGSSLDMSVMTEVSDVDVVLETAKTWDFVDTDRIFLQGGSQGGLVSAISGARHEDEVAGLILLYPAFGMPDFAKYRYSKDMPDEVTISGITVSKKFFEDLKDYDKYDDIAGFDKPVLILQGSEDSIVSPSLTREASELYPDATYHIIEGADHGFSGEYHDEATQYALDFLYQHT